MLIVLRLFQMWPLQVSFFVAFEYQSLVFLSLLSFLVVSVCYNGILLIWGCGFRFSSLFYKHLSFCSSCSHLIMLPLLSLHDLFSSVSLSGLITTECLQCKRRETNGKQIQSTHCLINQVV